MEKDQTAIEKRNLTNDAVSKLEESCNAGWLHNVLSRITPLTMRRREDYVTMADIFVVSADESETLLDRFDADIELFCSMAEISVTRHMTRDTVSDELKAHIDLYCDIRDLLVAKFDIEARDPILMLVESPIMNEATNPFIKEFMDERFKRN
ncbi:MAG: hypothetical protein ACI9TY_000243 [Alphaproteobacteria bacterium]